MAYIDRFLWVHFQLIDLCEAASDSAIRETLRNLPEGMAETYARILRKMGKSRQTMALAQRIFKWVVCAKRPLLLCELAEAVAFGPSDKSWDAGKIPTQSRLIQACGNLVVFSEDDKTVRLAHHTVQQFLLGPPIEDSILGFHFQLAQAEVEAGETCVAYLSFTDFESQITKFDSRNIPLASVVPSPASILTSTLGLRYSIIGRHISIGTTRYQMPNIDIGNLAMFRKLPSPSLREKYLFLNYAVKNWISHTSHFSEDNTSMWGRFKSLALGKPMPFDIRIWGDVAASQYLPYKPLFRWAINAGHVPLLKLLLQLPTGSNLHTYCNQDSEEIRSVIHSAARSGRGNVIEFLAQQACIDGGDGRPLLEAVQKGHDSVVQVLFEHDLCLGERAKALQIASERGDAAVMRLLLQNEPLIDLQTGWGKLALAEAAEKGFEGVLVLLLEKAATFEVAVDEVERIWANIPLHDAATRGFHSVTRVLLENGADVNAKDNGRWTALQRAADQGHMEVVQLLVENGAGVNAKDNAGWTALHRAAYQGHKAVLLLLVDNGADINAEDNDGWTAVHWVANQGHKEVVQLLVENGADVNAKNNHERTALHLAARKGRKEVVQLLVENGADVNAKDNGGWTAFGSL